MRSHLEIHSYYCHSCWGMLSSSWATHSGSIKYTRKPHSSGLQRLAGVTLGLSIIRRPIHISSAVSRVRWLLLLLQPDISTDWSSLGTGSIRRIPCLDFLYLWAQYLYVEIWIVLPELCQTSSNVLVTFLSYWPSTWMKLVRLCRHEALQATWRMFSFNLLNLRRQIIKITS